MISWLIGVLGIDNTSSNVSSIILINSVEFPLLLQFTIAL